MRIIVSAILLLSVMAIVPVPVAQEAPALPTPPGASTPPTGVTPGKPATLPATTAPTTTPPVSTPPSTITAPPTGTTTRPMTAVADDDELIPFTFENMQLATIIKLVAERTGRNFLIQTPITGTVLIYCPKLIPANTAFDILGLILDAQGYTMLVSESPALVFVTKKAGAESLPTEMIVAEEGTGPEEKHELATLIVVLKYVSVDDMQNILRNFKSTNCVMTAYPAGNFLILKDEEAKLKYLLTIIKKVDIQGTASQVAIVELKYADATETAAQLTELLAAREGARVTTTATRRPPTPRTTGGRPTARPSSVSPTIVGAAAPLKIMPDPRTNRLIILASEKDKEYILDLVERLDKEPTEEMYPIRTYVAQYQDAMDLADTLASFVAGQPRSTTGTQRSTSALRGTTARTTTGTTQARTTGPTTAARRTAVTGGTEEAFFLADPATNIVLVQAEPRKLDMYMNLLKDLDQPQKQVLIEVWIVEISSRSQLDIGVEFKPAEIGPAERIGPMQNEIFGGSNFDLGLGNLLSGTGFPSSGISMGLRSLTDTALDIGGKVYYIPNFDTFIRAMREDTSFSILSSPKLLTLNNEPATMDVSDEISISESRIASYAALEPDTAVPGGYTETFQRQNVGINLQITPQINSENSVIMEILLEVGSIAGVEDITQASSRPVIANRSTQTKVRVDNGRTIIISGLRRTDRTTTKSRVPILGEIPILGLLFSHERTLAVNTNLLIFITPHIVSDTLDILEVTDVLKNQDIEKERARFQPTRPVRKTRRPKNSRAPEWEWKK
ncbi:type II secretion system secretin GspD [bacterium]|nr:type II secretion system secretin GspD [bacterium]